MHVCACSCGIWGTWYACVRVPMCWCARVVRVCMGWCVVCACVCLVCVHACVCVYMGCVHVYVMCVWAVCLCLVDVRCACAWCVRVCVWYVCRCGGCVYMWAVCMCVWCVEIQLRFSARVSRAPAPGVWGAPSLGAQPAQPAPQPRLSSPHTSPSVEEALWP